MSYLDDGLNGFISALSGFILTLVLTALYFQIDWGDLDPLFKSVGLGFIVVFLYIDIKSLQQSGIVFGFGYLFGFILTSLC